MDRDDTLLAYLQGKLTPEDRARFEAEMAADPALAAEVEVMRAVRTNLSDAPQHAQADAVWDRLSAAIGTPPQAANQNRPYLRRLAGYAAVAVLAVVCWQVALVPLIGDVAPVYRTASEDGAGFPLQVRFADGATMSEITALLSDLDGTITDGPGALGLLRLSFPDEDRQQRALEALRGRAALVEFVQAP